MNKFLSSNLVSKENGIFVIELKKLGFNKLLGDGRVSLKLKINAPYASKTAIDKVKQAGGEVVGLNG